ncbi:MAG: hypothetical protein E6G64_16930 [Actinobacteria bacterium]|nr:MAG: hypothetical protein E6G64_16930 [Actinomycetota bacterium]
MSFCRSLLPLFVGTVEPRKGQTRRTACATCSPFTRSKANRWRCQRANGRPESPISASGFAEHAGSGRIVEGHRLGRGSEAKESVGSYAVVDVKDEDEAIAIAKRWPGGGAVEVRPVAD